MLGNSTSAALNVYTVGHSLGAAMAQLAAAGMENYYQSATSDKTLAPRAGGRLVTGVYAFASPKTGRASWLNRYK